LNPTLHILIQNENFTFLSSKNFDFSMEYILDVSDWSKCSNTCGKGTRDRNINCIKVDPLRNFRDSLPITCHDSNHRNIVENEECEKLYPFPKTQEDCYDFTTCENTPETGKWIVGEWDRVCSIEFCGKLRSRNMNTGVLFGPR